MANIMQRFIHRYVAAGTEADDRPHDIAESADGEDRTAHETSLPTHHPLLLLHGTGGDENQLLGLGRQLDPDAALLSPKGQIDENGMARFFRRVAEGVFDLEDLVARTHELAAFIKEAKKAYELTQTRFVAVGFSNGANMAGSLLLLYPQLFAGAVLYRPMVPFVPELMPDLQHASVLVMPGERDRLVPVEEARRLIELLERTGATVEAHWQPGGHRMTDDDITTARRWLAALNE